MPSKTTKVSADPAAELAAQRRAEYEAVQAEARAFDEYSQSVPTPARILTTWSNGDARYSALDYLAAKAEHSDRLPKLRAGLQARLRTAKERLLPEVPELAVAAAKILGEALGIDAKPVIALPRDIAYSAGDSTLYVVQDRMHSVADVTTGALTGRISVQLVRDKRFTKLDGRTVLNALRHNEWVLDNSVSDAIRTAPCEGGEIDSLAPFTVHRAHPAVPAIAQLSTYGLAGGMAHRLAVALNESVVGGLGLSGSAGDGEARIVSSKADAEGVVTSVVEVPVQLSTPKGKPAFADLMELAKRALGSLEGVYTRAGKVTGVKLTGRAGPVSSGFGYVGAHFTVRLTTVSRRPAQND